MLIEIIKARHPIGQSKGCCSSADRLEQPAPGEPMEVVEEVAEERAQGAVHVGAEWRAESCERKAARCNLCENPLCCKEPQHAIERRRVRIRGLRQVVAVARAIPQQISDAEFGHHIQGLRDMVPGTHLSQVPYIV